MEETHSEINSRANISQAEKKGKVLTMIKVRNRRQHTYSQRETEICGLEESVGKKIMFRFLKYKEKQSDR